MQLGANRKQTVMKDLSMKNEDIIKIMRPYTAHTLIKTEKWLKEQSLKGLQLVSLKGWSFRFRECPSEEREYFYIYLPSLTNLTNL